MSNGDCQSQRGNKKNYEHAAKVTHDLQVADLDKCYKCPILAFSFLDYNELGYRAELELCLDLLSCCDKLIVASGLSQGVYREIEFAKEVGMEIEFI